MRPVSCNPSILVHTHRSKEGIPSMACAWYWLAWISDFFPRPSVLWKQRDLGWNLTQRFGECRGPPQVGNDVGEAWEERDWTDSQEQGTDADVFCGIPECWIRFVFGTQLPGIMFAVSFFPCELQHFHLYVENSLSQHPSKAIFHPLKRLLLSHIRYIYMYIYMQAHFLVQ